jgi:hypothetical protein
MSQEGNRLELLRLAAVTIGLESLFRLNESFTSLFRFGQLSCQAHLHGCLDLGLFSPRYLIKPLYKVLSCVDHKFFRMNFTFLCLPKYLIANSKFLYVFFYLQFFMASTFGQVTITQLGNDIDGEAGGDWSGVSVSVSADGNTLAAGSHVNNGTTGPFTGHVRLYTWDGTAWLQKGNDIDGEHSYGQSGISLGLSDDGNTVVIGAQYNYATFGYGSNSGHARVFNWDGIGWVQQGADIDGEDGSSSGYAVTISGDATTIAIGAQAGGGSLIGHTKIYSWDGTNWIQKGITLVGEGGGDQSGMTVSLSENGNVVAIGSCYNDGGALNSGHVRVYEWNGTIWIQRGIDLDGNGIESGFGRSVSLTPSGNRLAVGGTGTTGLGADSGFSQVYEWNGTDWIQMGTTIDAEASGDFFGHAVSLNEDGTVLAVGGSYNDGGGVDAGHVRIYKWDGTNWNQYGPDIDGEADGDRSGWFVSLNHAGNRVAIGAPRNNGTGDDAGHVRVYSITDLSASVIENNGRVGFELYPNPTTGKFSIKSDSGVKMIRVMDCQGRIIFEEIFTDYLNTIEVVFPFNAGVYLVHLETQDGFQTGCLIKE